jgi:hypothetical protein
MAAPPKSKIQNPLPYLVAPRPGNKSTNFQEYARLLRQQGIDLARAPRTLHPVSGRWLHVWDDEAGARRFAKELARRTTHDAWQVEMVGVPVALGPLGPLLIELSRRSDGLLFGLHPLSRMVLTGAFPKALGATSVFFDAQRWRHYHASGGSFDHLAWKMALALTGLSEYELDEIGVEVIDDDTDETLYERRS